MSKPFENAFWIWDDGDPAPVNAYRIFRKVVELPSDAEPDQQIFIVAENNYELVVNGQRVCSGPAPSARNVATYDFIVAKLVPGALNVLTVTVFYAGVPMFARHESRGGLLFAMNDFVSDSSWLVAKESGYDTTSPRLSVQQGFAEYVDANRFPRGAYYGEIDPDEWMSATIVTAAGGDPWPILEERDIPLVDVQWKPYKRLLGYGNCESVEIPNAAVRLENETLQPLTAGRVTVDVSGIVIEPAGNDVWLLFDMGQEVSGYVEVDIESLDGGNSSSVVEIGYAEALGPGETPSGLRHTGGDSSQLNYGDRLMLEAGEGHFSSFNPRAFRYLRVAVRNVDSPFRIASAGVQEALYPVADRGVFACSDARLDHIYEIGRRTLHLCMEDRFMDCPWRERAQWVADARIQAIGAMYAFGDHLLHRRFLRQTALSQYPDGRIDPVGPGEWDVYSPNNPIPGFVAIYIQSVLDYHIMTGDDILVAEVLPAVQKALGWLGTYGASEGGLLTNVPGWNFTDWAEGLSGGNEGITAAVNLFYYQALKAAVKLADSLGNEAASASYGARAEMVAAAFDSLFWNPLRGVYVDAVVDGEQGSRASQQVNTLALLAGIGSDARRMSISQRLLSDESLTQIGSPYFSYYLVEALAKIGRHQTALDYIRAKWGAMMDAGATSWWEEWHGKTSRCHAWSIAPTIWLPQQVLGVTAREPGFTCVNVCPSPCDLEWARGIVPTPAGDVVVYWQRKDSRFTLDVTIPTGVHLRTILPCGPSDQLFVDGAPVSEDAIIRRSKTRAELAVLPGSGYRFEVVAAQ
jgi:alpha-L-rhamnosidase